MRFHITLIFLHQPKQRWLDEELLLSLKLDGLGPFKLDGIADDSDLLSNGPEIGPALGESMGQTMGDIVLPQNGPEIGPALGKSVGQTMGECAC
jgi:hypothetical protein